MERSGLDPSTAPIVLGITGASGAGYAVRLLETLLIAGCHVHLCISTSGREVIHQELSRRVDLDTFTAADLFEPAVRERIGDALSRITYYHHANFYAPCASGSFRTSGMVICPCSGTTLSAIAAGSAGNLIQRAAEVHLKEHRRLILVPRETPLSLMQIDNMRRTAAAGATILPASPGWYHGVQSIDDLLNFVVVRICDQLGVETHLMKRWGDA